MSKMTKTKTGELRKLSQEFKAGSLRAGTPGVVDGVLRDPRTYFFDLIGRQIGQNCEHDWEPTLRSLVDRGMQQNVLPNTKPTRAMPFHGIAMMMSGGKARGRIFLPAAVPQIGDDGTQWFTRDVQVIERVGDHHVWAWNELSGHPFVPVQEIDGDGPIVPVNPPVNPPTPTSDIERRMAELEASVERSNRESSSRIDRFIEESNARLEGALSRDDVQSVVSENLGRVRVDIDVKKAGPKVRFLGQSYDLAHDHGVEASLSLDGQRVQHLSKSFTTSGDAEIDSSQDVPKPAKKKTRKPVGVKSI
jgi:hypothetical protein